MIILNLLANLKLATPQFKKIYRYDDSDHFNKEINLDCIQDDLNYITDVNLSHSIILKPSKNEEMLTKSSKVNINK